MAYTKKMTPPITVAIPHPEDPAFRFLEYLLSLLRLRLLLLWLLPLLNPLLYPLLLEP
jgi:hypothetical protein